MISSSSIRFQLLLSTAVAASLALPARAIAAPLPVPAAPNPNITTSGNTETVVLTNPRTVINWNSFDIDQGFAVDINGNSTGQAVLNRVVTPDPSGINGTLTSDPDIEVFLINPYGIIFGSTARVDVGSFVASTLGIDDNDFLLGDLTPTEFSFFSVPQLSTGVEVNNGAKLTTESGNLVLIGGFVTVDNGGVLNSAGDAALIATNSVTIPADPGSPLAFSISLGNPTPVANGITVGGQITGKSVALYQNNFADAVDALLLVTPTAKITATGGADGDIVLSLAARTTNEGGFIDSPGRVENDGQLTASGSIYLGGTTSDGSVYLPRTVANGGTIDAGVDVLMQARHLVTNSGQITADRNVTLSAIASGYESAPIPNVQVVNDGTINAGGDVNLIAKISVSAFASAYATGPLTAQVTNSGSITAGGDVDLSAIIDVGATVSAAGSSSPAGIANAGVFNKGSIDAGGDVNLVASIAALAVPSTLAPGPVTASGATGNVQVTNSGSIDAGGGVNLIGSIFLSASGVSFDSLPNADVEIANSGSIDAGGDVHLVGSIDALALNSAMNASVHVANSGDIAASGDVFLSAMASFSGPAPNIDVLNDGSIIADGSVMFFAESGDITNSGFVSAGQAFTAEASNGSIFNSGTIVAGANGSLFADGNITNSGSISVDGVALLDAGNDIDNSGSVSAGGDAILTAVNDILDSSGTFAGTISGADVAVSAGGSITVGSVTARDDIAIRADGGPVTAGSLISGATIDGQGPVDIAGAADELLPGVDLSGHDIDVDGTAIAVDVVHALGTGSDIRLREPVTSSRQDLDFFAGGDITINGSASAVDVAMDAGGTITAGDISARDDIALRAGSTLVVGILQSGVTIDGQGPVDQAGSADALLGQTLLGHDLFVQGGTVDLTRAIANGTNSDLTVRATTGELSILDGEAGGMITLVKQGTTGILTADTLLAGTGATLTSDTDIEATTVETVTGDLAFTARGNVTVVNPLAADDVAIDAGGTINTADISARDDIALRAGNTLHVGTLTSGIAIGGTGPVDTAGAADALLDENLAGHDIFVQGGNVTLSQATANGAGSDLTVDATSGDLNIITGTAGGAIALTKEGATGILTAATLIAGTGASLTSSTSITANNVQSASGNILFDAMQGVTVGTVTAQAGNVNFLANDLDINNSVTGSVVSITNRNDGNDNVTVLGDASAAGAFTLTQDELNRIHAPVVSIDSLNQDVLIGNVAFANDVGSTRLNLLGTARFDIVGAITASGAARTLQIGGTLDPADPNDPSTMASIIRIVPTSQAGGRIIVDGALDLRGMKIGVGLDDGFLNPLGLDAGGTPASTQSVQDDWILNRNSSLYGIPGGYANPLVISAGSITITYGDYALFQNTGSNSFAGVDTGILSIISSGSDGNGFELFGTIDGVGGKPAALLVQPTTVSMGNSRVNTCLIVTGAGCGAPGDPTAPWPQITTVDPTGDANSTVPPLSGGAAAQDFAEQDLVSSDDEKALNFDSLVGTNNEGLLGILGVDDANAPANCAPDDKRDICRSKDKSNDQ